MADPGTNTSSTTSDADAQTIIKFKWPWHWFKQESFWQSIATNLISSGVLAAAIGFGAWLTASDPALRTAAITIACVGVAILLVFVALTVLSRSEFKKAAKRLKDARRDESSGVSTGVAVLMTLILAALIGVLLLVRSWQ